MMVYGTEKTIAMGYNLVAGLRMQGYVPLGSTTPQTAVITLRVQLPSASAEGLYVSKLTLPKRLRLVPNRSSAERWRGALGRSGNVPTMAKFQMLFWWVDWGAHKRSMFFYCCIHNNDSSLYIYLDGDSNSSVTVSLSAPASKLHGMNRVWWSIL